MSGRIDAVWFDMAGEDAEHQQAEQCKRQTDAYSQRLGGTFRLTLVLNQKHHATGETDKDCDQRCNDKDLDQHFSTTSRGEYQIF